MPAWAQFFHIHWPPALRFFEVRTQLLRDLETDGCLEAFRWEDGLIGARLGKSAILEVRPTGADIFCAMPDGDRGACEQALTRALSMIEPPEVFVRHASFLYVAPMRASYDEARVHSATQLLGNALPGGSASDWSLLVDGTSDLLDARYQVEFGIVNDEEAAERLTRSVGRTMGPETDDLRSFPPDFWRLDEIPSVALFMDWKWWPGGTAGRVEGIDGVVQVWSTLTDHSQEMADAISQRLGQNGQASQGTGT